MDVNDLSIVDLLLNENNDAVVDDDEVSVQCLSC
jgi:hypothetical protein